MKKILISAILFLVGLSTSYAQTTPNLNFNVPVAGTLNWSIPLNSNMNLLDSYLSGVTYSPNIAWQYKPYFVNGTPSSGLCQIAGTNVNGIIAYNYSTTPWTPYVCYNGVMTLFGSGGSITYPVPGIVKSTGAGWGAAAIYSDVAALFSGCNSTNSYFQYTGTCGPGGALPGGVTSPSTGSLQGSGFFQASMIDAGGQVYNVKAYGATGNTRATNDATMTAGGTSLVSATANFTSADTGKNVAVPMGPQVLQKGTYTSGITATGSAGQTCLLSGFTGGGGSGATATVYLTGTNTIAASAPLYITALGTGFTSAPTGAAVANGTATCTGTAVVSTSVIPSTVVTTATYVSSTNLTLGVAATVSFSSGHMEIGTNDCTAVTNANTAKENNGAGNLFFPAGRYFLGASCPISITVPTIVSGVGKCSTDTLTCGSAIVDVDPTGTLFTHTGLYGLFRDAAELNVANAVVSGAGVFTNSSNALQRVDFENWQVNGFYDDVHVGVGTEWHMTGSYMQNFGRYGVYVQNNVNPDFGDWLIGGNTVIAGGGLVNKTNYPTSAGIRYETGGGGKINHIKIIQEYTGGPVDGIQMNLSGSGETQVTAVNIEGISQTPINIINGWPYITLTDNILSAGAGYCGINSVNNTHVYIAGGNIHGAGGGTNAICMSGTGGYILVMPVETGGFTNVFSGCAGFSNCTDNSNLNAQVFNGTSVTATDTNASMTGGEVTAASSQSTGAAGYLFKTWNGSAFITNSFTCSYYNGGCIVTLPRSISSTGFIINNTSNSPLFSIDSSNGNGTFAGTITSNGSGTSTIGGPLNVSGNFTMTGSQLLAQSTSSSTTAVIKVNSGASNPYAFYYSGYGGTSYWAWGQNGGTPWTLNDQGNGHAVINFPYNTMPANSIGGNANGATTITQAALDNTTNIATDAFVQTAINQGPALATPTTISSTSFVTSGLALPVVPISTTKHGHCNVIWEQSTGIATVSFGIGFNNAPTNFWVGTKINTSAAGALAVGYTTTTATTPTLIGAAAAPAVINTPYFAEFDFVLQTGGTNSVIPTLYGLTSNASDALVIEPGSYCSWML